MVIAQACCSGRSLSRGSQAENLCAIPMPPLKSTRQSQHHHLLVHHAVIWPHQWDGPRAAAPHPLPCCPMAQKGATCYWDTEETATLTARLSIEWLESHSHLGETGVPMTTRPPLRCVFLTQMTNFPASVEQVLFERQHCADKPNKCKVDIAVPIITPWSFFLLFFFFLLLKENNGVGRYEPPVWWHDHLFCDSCYFGMI